MKMEHVVASAADGVLTELLAAAGDQVAAGQVLAVVAPAGQAGEAGEAGEAG
jgi:biotin carboxyl carrier protein